MSGGGDKDCAKTRTRKTTMPFYCRKPRGHEGKCSPYTLAPMTRERWAELGIPHPAQRSAVVMNGGRFEIYPVPQKLGEEL